MFVGVSLAILDVAVFRFGGPDDGWILLTGFWRDAGIWIDTDVWVD